MAGPGELGGVGPGEGQPDTTNAEEDRPYARLSVRVQVAGLGVLALCLVALLVAIGTRVRQVQYAECQSAVTDQYIAAGNARAEAAAADRKVDQEEKDLLFEAWRSQVEFVNAVLASKTEAEVLEAFRQYQLKVAAVDRGRDQIASRRSANEQQRRENPLPAPPSQTCA